MQFLRKVLESLFRVLTAGTPGKIGVRVGDEVKGKIKERVRRLRQV